MCGGMGGGGGVRVCVYVRNVEFMFKSVWVGIIRCFNDILDIGINCKIKLDNEK